MIYNINMRRIRITGHEPTKPPLKWKPWHLLIKPSTLEFTRQARNLPGFTLWDWLHGFVYARLTYLYIGTGIGGNFLSKILNRGLRLASSTPTRQGQNVSPRLSMADMYHGKVIPLDSARQLVTIREDVHFTNLEQIIPYPKARDLILQNPDHIAVFDCPCRSARKDPCLPLDVCLIIGEPFASFVTEHHRTRSRWITAAQAVEILKAEDARGHAHHAFFKDAMLGRFYAICNCCSCCCGAIQSHRSGSPMLASSGYVAKIEHEQCLGCGICADNCQFHALSITMEGVAHVDLPLCMGCGVCVDKCPNEAISMLRMPEKGVPLEIKALMDQSLSGT